ncbi:unnamed protein product [Allacma fusca]|uniref:G-protein coupled receptors family 1 profile domain-containing protein n=1 Tax=Allacma fusca TaxID=39272 RepID=A0A8J2KRK2_9HEXA|nr:unnamed protein product [Allacma fusca]
MSEYRPCLPQLVLSQKELWTVFVIHNGIVLVSCLGLIGNIISGIVLSMPQMRCSYSLLLIALTVSDSIQLLGNIVLFGSQALKYCKIILTPADTIGPTFDKILSMSAYVAYTASAYLTAVVSFERYTAVCLPFRARRFFLSRRRSFLYALAVTGFAVLFNLPKWFETMACQDRIPPRNITNNNVEWSGIGNFSGVDEPAVHILGEIRIMYNELYHNSKAYRVAYLFLANFLINFVIPLVILIVLNVWMYIEMRKSTTVRESMTVGQINENSITVMLIVVVGIFWVCHMWFAVKILILEFCGKKCFSRVYIELSNFLLAFNASINFVIYCLCGSKFRKQLLLLFSCVKTGRFSNSGKCDGNRNVSTKV